MMRSKHINKRMNYLYLFFVLAVVLIFFTVFRTGVQAGTAEKSAYYTSVRLEKGDTLWSIAEQYAPGSDRSTMNHYVDQLMDLNGLTRCDNLRPGSWLSVIYYQ